MEEDLVNVEPNCLILLGYEILPKICYREEISGKSNELYKLIKYSKKYSCTILAFTEFDLFGKQTFSVFGCSNGKILGIADQCCNGLENCELKIFKTNLGKIGIVVGNDIFELKNSRLLAENNADFLIHFFAEKIDQRLLSFVYVNGYLNNLHIISLNKNSCLVLKKDKVKTDLILETEFSMILD